MTALLLGWTLAIVLAVCLAMSLLILASMRKELDLSQEHAGRLHHQVCASEQERGFLRATIDHLDGLCDDHGIDKSGGPTR